jgi:hypothetical protein
MRVVIKLLAGAIIICLAVLIASDQALAQPSQPSGATNQPQITLPTGANQPPRQTNNASKAGERPTDREPVYTTTKTPYEFYLAALTIFLGVSALVLVSLLFWRHIREKSDEFVKLFAFIIVVFSAIFLIVVGYADSQVAPVYSLLGTIIGYVFGREVGRPAATATTPPTTTTTTTTPVA